MAKARVLTSLSTRKDGGFLDYEEKITMSDDFKIAAFYHFTDLPDRDEWADRIVDHGLKVGLRGTIIFAPEGVNSTCAGACAAVDATIALLKSDPRFESMEVNTLMPILIPFQSLRLKKSTKLLLSVRRVPTRGTQWALTWNPRSGTI